MVKMASFGLWSFFDSGACSSRILKFPAPPATERRSKWPCSRPSELKSFLMAPWNLKSIQCTIRAWQVCFLFEGDISYILWTFLLKSRASYIEYKKDNRRLGGCLWRLNQICMLPRPPFLAGDEVGQLSVSVIHLAETDQFKAVISEMPPYSHFGFKKPVKHLFKRQSPFFCHTTGRMNVEDDRSYSFEFNRLRELVQNHLADGEGIIRGQIFCQ